VGLVRYYQFSCWCCAVGPLQAAQVAVPRQWTVCRSSRNRRDTIEKMTGGLRSKIGAQYSSSGPPNNLDSSWLLTRARSPRSTRRRAFGLFSFHRRERPRPRNRQRIIVPAGRRNLPSRPSNITILRAGLPTHGNGRLRRIVGACRHHCDMTAAEENRPRRAHHLLGESAACMRNSGFPRRLEIATRISRTQARDP